MVNPSRSGDLRHPWVFRARFRRHAFGWTSQPAIQRVREAVAEIKKVARTDPVLAAEGAVLFLGSRYGLWANRAGTYTAWFRAAAAKYLHERLAEILADLVAGTPGEEGKWFVTAKDAGFLKGRPAGIPGTSWRGRVTRNARM